jgi:hypothetical protein
MRIFPVETDDVAAPRELGKQRLVVEFAGQQRCDAPRGCIGAAVKKQEVEAERIACEREHLAELAGAHDTYCHAPGVLALWSARVGFG